MNVHTILFIADIDSGIRGLEYSLPVEMGIPVVLFYSGPHRSTHNLLTHIDAAKEDCEIADTKIGPQKWKVGIVSF